MRNEKLSWCRIVFFILAGWLFFLFFSCTSTKTDSHFSPVFVANSSKFDILPPQAMTGSIEELQRMEAVFGKTQIEAEIYVIANSDQLSMILMSEFGTTVAELFYDGENLDFESLVFPKKLKPEYIVADFQFALYDAEILKKELAKSDVDFKVSVEEKNSELIETRTLSQKGRLIARITKTRRSDSNNQNSGLGGGAIKYENLLRGYSYELTGVSE